MEKDQTADRSWPMAQCPGLAPMPCQGLWIGSQVQEAPLRVHRRQDKLSAITTSFCLAPWGPPSQIFFFFRQQLCLPGESHATAASISFIPTTGTCRVHTPPLQSIAPAARQPSRAPALQSSVLRFHHHTIHISATHLMAPPRPSPTTKPHS